MTILLLTKSLSFEQDFVRKLNDLGHEVLCSKKFLIDLLTNDYFGMDLNYFDTLIFSETISDQEVSHILPFFLNFTCKIYRKTTNPLSPEVARTWRELGVTGLISQMMRFDELREELITCNEKKFALKWTSENSEDRTIEMMVRDFSRQELQVFRILQASKDDYISRENLSQQLWGEAPTKSKESRLSGIIRSIKEKLSTYGFDDSCLETSWGHGYRLKRIKLKKMSIEVPKDLKVVES
ncbi:helix-turn-helix domain-containing protein [Enterococcus raffinosus]|uniref:winged helix-turn-helix domain-containing protein n=1 Tax=Enterococcus raffinosus TaxID=71452 RepID=UPI001C10444E|nr:helix-turn-helix domain-containing protein [Enterococcus raffinosus]MBU5359602.1 helix-turn-helix domain-containing protein [Enterococcus raffinosus]